MEESNETQSSEGWAVSPVHLTQEEEEGATKETATSCLYGASLTQ